MEQRLSLASMSITILLSLLFAFAWSANARKDSGDYWKGVMKDEPMPATLEALILPNPVTKSLGKPNCHHDVTKSSSSSGEDHILDDLQPRPSVTSYVKEGTTGNRDGAGGEEHILDDPQPRPSLTSYVTGNRDEEANSSPVFKSFEPRPTVTSYHVGDLVVVVEQNPSMSSNKYVGESFEPRPNVSAYGD